jgi:hypothetical protein
LDDPFAARIEDQHAQLRIVEESLADRFREDARGGGVIDREIELAIGLQSTGNRLIQQELAERLFEISDERRAAEALDLNGDLAARLGRRQQLFGTQVNVEGSATEAKAQGIMGNRPAIG